MSENDNLPYAYFRERGVMLNNPLRVGALVPTLSTYTDEEEKAYQIQLRRRRRKEFWSDFLFYGMIFILRMLQAFLIGVGLYLLIHIL